MIKRLNIILVCFLLLATSCGWCIDEDIGPEFVNIAEELERLEIYFETEMYEEAAMLLDELVAQFPEEPRLRYLRAIVDYQRQDYDSASAVFIEFIEEYPDVPEPYYLLGEMDFNKGNLEKAREYFMEYCALVPEDYDAHDKLQVILTNIHPGDIAIIKDGKEDLNIVKKVGFYGACVHSQQGQSLKLINGSFRAWSSMGIDFVYPLDFRAKTIVLKLRGKQGGEKFQLTFRDRFARDFTPQLMLEPEEKGISCEWEELKVVLDAQKANNIDLSCVVHMGLEFGLSTVQNSAHSVLFVKDIIIEDAHN